MCVKDHSILLVLWVRKEQQECRRQTISTCAELDMTSLLREIFLPRGCCCILGVYWPESAG
jgi:hypothetical protein